MTLPWLHRRRSLARRLAGCITIFLLAGSASAAPYRFLAWLDLHFSPEEQADPALAGPLATPAGDGVANLLKYALGVAPREAVPASRQPALAREAGEWIFAYSRLRHAPDLAFEVQVSENLVDWHSGWDRVEERSQTATGATERVQVVAKGVDGASPSVFARMRVALVPTPAVATRPAVAWNFSIDPRTVPQPPTTLDPDATTSGLQLGPGLTSDGANRTWGATDWGVAGAPLTTAQAAVDAGKTFHFTVTPAANRTLSFARLTYKVRRLSSAPADFIWQVQVGTGPFRSIGEPVRYTGTDTNGLQQPDLDLLPFADLHAVAEPVTFRFVAWNGTGLLALGRDTGDGLALFISETTVSDVLRATGEDFDPWNQQRWAAWYQDGRLDRPFVIDCSLKFASRADPWYPDVTALPAGSALFNVVQPGLSIHGNDVVIDVRPEAYRNRTLAQVIAGGIDEATASQPVSQGFSYAAARLEGVPASVLRNLTLMGFVQGVRTTRTHTHPLVVAGVTFSRNSTGLYLSSSGAVATGCSFIENSHTGSYHGSGSNANRMVGNQFRDNNYTLRPSYGDIVMDTAYASTIADNDFQPSQSPQGQFRAAIAFYRNLGEDGSLREDFPRDNLIHGNTFDGYSVALNLGARHGRAEHAHDLSREGRDYVAANHITANVFRNSSLGIKLNTSGNVIEGNQFTHVLEPIVLHAVAYNLVETTINDQQDTNVSLWTQPSHYTAYSAWFTYQSPLMNVIPAAEKLIHVRSDYGTPTFTTPGAAGFLLAPSLASDDALQGTYSTGGTPRAIAVGDFYDNQSGDELAVIWEEPISRVGSTTYHSILFYDRDGTEINRSGRGTTRWAGITAGRFASGPTAVQFIKPTDQSWSATASSPVRLAGIAGGRFDPASAGAQVAAIGSTADPLSGTYPIYFLTPGATTAPAQAAVGTALPWTAIASGDFAPERDGDEVVVSGGGEPAGPAALPCFALGDTLPRRVLQTPWPVLAPRSLAAGNLPAAARNPAYERFAGLDRAAWTEQGPAWGDALIVLPESSPSGALPVLWVHEDPQQPARRSWRITPILR